MFWDNWIPKKYLVKSEVCGVEVNFNDNGISFYYTLLKNKNNKLVLTETGQIKDNLELPKSIVKNKIPLVVILNGKGIILKKIFHSESPESTEEIIKQNLPAINPAEFYIQIYKQENQSGFIAVCRKEIANSLISDLNSKKYDVAELLIGAPSVIGLKPLWSNFNNLQTSTHSIEFTNGLADNLTARLPGNENKIKIDDIIFSPLHTLGFAGGLAYLLKTPLVENNNTELENIAVSHIEKNKFRLLLILFVAIAFLLAATNMIFYTSFFDKNNKLETELSVYQGKYEQINKLLNDYQNKKGLIENAGVLNKNKLSEFADKIAKTIPDEVVLSEMYFNPKDEDIESEDSLVKFKSNELILKGNCNKSLVINEWVNVLKMQKFIKDISLEKFSYNKEGILPNYEIKLITE